MNEKTPIIILNWNGIEDTIECIDSVLKTQSIDFHIYLIDNNSEAPQQEKLKILFGNHEKINLYFNDKNLGFTHAHIKIWEDVLQTQKFTYIALLNNDTTVDPKWLSNLINKAKETNASIVSAKMINYYNRSSMDNAGHRMLSTGEIIPIGHGHDIQDFTSPFTNLGACAGACLYQTEMLNKIGFFDPHFSTGYEDAELGLRAFTQGYISIFAPNAVVYHKMGQSIKKVFNEEYSLMIHSAILYSYFKNMPHLNILLTIPSFIFKYLSMFVINLVFGRKKYMRIMRKSWQNVSELKQQIKRERQKLSKSRIRYVSHPYFISFLWFDIKRFWNLIIKNKASAIDKYGE